MQKFGENGDEFWWDDEVRSLELNIISFLMLPVFIVLLHYAKADPFSFISSLAIILVIVLGMVTRKRYKKKNIPQLYLNNQGIAVYGTFCSWDDIRRIEIKVVTRGRRGIFIYHWNPENKTEGCFLIDPEEDEIMQIKLYIEAFWEYYKTN